VNIDIPEGQDAVEYVWGTLVPGIGPAAATASKWKKRSPKR